ncbi:CDI toxin immunity protein [Paenibacillus durus]|uniref:CDI toxin immunity protein n=1 Tax=Paenibacillus durus TaxID=44251 RepID=UPI0004B0B9B8
MYIVWSHGTNPVLEAGLEKIIKNIDDVTAVSPDVWLYKPNKYVIEFFHEGTITRTISTNQGTIK